MDEQGGVASVDEAIARVAGAQHGVVSRAQLRRLGIGRRAIEHRIVCGRLRPLYRGVYAVGHSALTQAGRWMAAVLASGSGAVLSHHAAGANWALRVAAKGPEVTAPVQRRRAGITIHVTSLAFDEVTVHRGLPTTTVARTLFDLAGVLSPHAFERALDEAEYLRLAGPLSLADLVLRHPRRPGAVTIHRLLADRRLGGDVSPDVFESTFLAFLDEQEIPRPVRKPALRIGGRAIEPDGAWPAARLIVELDGAAAHMTWSRHEGDRARDGALHVAGWTVVRVTWRQLHHDRPALAADLRALLAS